MVATVPGEVSRAGVPDLHLPLRPSWRCTDDGMPWPCAVAQQRMWMQSDGDLVLVAQRMAEFMRAARTELPGLSAAGLQERFVGWVVAGPPRRPVVFRLMGNEPGA